VDDKMDGSTGEIEEASDGVETSTRETKEEVYWTHVGFSTHVVDLLLQSSDVNAEDKDGLVPLDWLYRDQGSISSRTGGERGSYFCTFNAQQFGIMLVGKKRSRDDSDGLPVKRFCIRGKGEPLGDGNTRRDESQGREMVTLLSQVRQVLVYTQCPRSPWLLSLPL
jgi:hypothetical protein